MSYEEDVAKARRAAAEHPGSQWYVLIRDGDRRVEYGHRSQRPSEGGVFDELAVDHWLHIEQVDDRTWWMRVGDARIEACVSADGNVTVDVLRGFHDELRGTTEEYIP